LHNHLLISEHPEIAEEMSKKDKELDDRLKKVFVTASEAEQKRPVNPNRPLPTSTEHIGFFELGFKETEPTEVPLGKVSLRKVIQFIEDYKMSPEVWSKEKIASEYKLNLEDVNNVLEHYRLFTVHIPAKGEEKKKVLLRSGYETQNFNEYLKTLKDKAGYETPKISDKISDLFRKQNEQKSRK
jgi:uncharacterized protein YktA (UPF0223 family)